MKVIDGCDGNEAFVSNGEEASFKISNVGLCEALKFIILI